MGCGRVTWARSHSQSVPKTRCSAPPAPTPVAPELQPGYDDSAWPLVDAPHDYIVTQPFSNATGSKKTGYFPRSNAVYRKHFALPAAWGH